MRGSPERHVACADRFDATVSEAKPHCTVHLDSIEAAGDAFVGTTVDLQTGSNGMRPGKPCLGKRNWFRHAPTAEQAKKASRQQWRKGLRRKIGDGFQRRSLPTRDVRRAGKINPEAGDDPVARSLKQNAGKLSIAKHQIVGPFKRQRSGGHGDLNRLDERKTRNQGERRRGRICGQKLNQRRAEEVSFNRLPSATVTAPPTLLSQCNQPVAFYSGVIGKQVAIG